MLSRLVITLSLILQVLVLNAQTGWTWSNPLPQGNPLHSISFLRDYGMAVGEQGTAIHTRDGGATWQIVDLGTRENLNEVVMHDDLMAFIAGDNGLLLWVMYHEDDDSFEIKKLSSGTMEDLNAITSDINGCPWAAGKGGVVLRSSDFGESWTRQNLLYQPDLNDLHNIECTEAWAVGPEGLVIYTSDLGVSWSYRGITTPWDLYAVHVGTFENIRVCGQQGSIWKTADKGVNWEPEHEETGYNLYGLVNVGLNGAYAAGDQGMILETSDYGATWEPRSTGTSTTLYDITFHGLGYDEVWAAGHYGTLLKNEGVGSDFELQTTGPQYWLNSVAFMNDQKGCAVGREKFYGVPNQGIILRTTDGGVTWVETFRNDTPLRAVCFVNVTTGWAVGDDGVILHTGNGGSHWEPQESGLMSDLNAVHFINETHGWAVSMYADIIHTSDGGMNWGKQTNPDINPLHDVYFIDTNLGFSVGLDSTIMRTTNGGADWQRLSPGISRGYRFASVYFTDENHGCVAGIDGSILLTEDGGDSWTEIESGVDEILNDVFFADRDNGWIAGDRGTILRTVNGGRSWFKQNTGVAANFLCGVYFSDLYHGCTVGEGGTILTTSDGGFKFEYGVFRNSGSELAIQDLMTTRDTITPDFGDGYSVTDIQVFMDTILHPSVGDLEIFLEHEGIRDTLVCRLPNGGEDMLWTSLSDKGMTDIARGVAPYSGEYCPYGDLSVFHGTDPSGDWILSIYDAMEDNTGTLRSWGIRPLYERVTGMEPVPQVFPGKLELEQNYPNPVTGSTVIQWNSRLDGKVLLNVYTMEGKLIATPVNEYLPAGKHTVSFDATGLPPGLYYYRIRSGTYSAGMKMMVIE